MNEKQNTFRRLNNEPLLISSIWCRLGWHNWTKWGDPYKVVNRDVQTRHCAHCNKFQAIELMIKRRT